jgi:hypothetical protein
MSVYDVAEMAGHTDWKVTALYYRQNGDDKRKNLEQLMQKAALA